MVIYYQRKILGYLLVQRVILLLAFFHVALSRKKKMDDPDMGHWEYDYNKNGNLIYAHGDKGLMIVMESNFLKSLLSAV